MLENKVTKLFPIASCHLWNIRHSNMVYGMPYICTVKREILTGENFDGCWLFKYLMENILTENILTENILTDGQYLLPNTVLP